MKRYQIAGFITLTLLILVAPAHAGMVFSSWSGSGSSGIDPFGHSWQIKNTTNPTVGSWGMPGFGDGLLTYQGSETATGFRIQFFDLPSGIAIDENVGSVTGMLNYDGAPVFWEAQFSNDNQVIFQAAPGTALNFGDQFFINVGFTDLLPDVTTVSFEAEWMGASNAVPEPASLALFGLGSLGAVVITRRRKKRMNAAA